MKKFYTILAIASLALVSCQKAVQIVEPTGLNIDKTTLELMPGQTADLSATIAPANATSKALTWKSSNTAVATVTGYGQVAAIAPNMKEMGNGTATITATTTDGKISVNCEVTVKPYYITNFDVTAEKTSIAAYDMVTLKPVFTPSNASYKDVTWTSSDETVAKVKDGVVTGYKEGEVKIKAVTKDGEKTVEKTITVTASKNLNIWVNDAAGEAALEAGTAEVSEGWLKYKNGKVTWEANKTGLPRFATVRVYDETTKELKGAAAVTQLEAKDFAGSWKLFAKLFDPHKVVTTTGGTINKHEGAVQFVNLDTPTANGNNMLVCDLYKTAEVEAKVDVDYEAKTAKVGIFLSRDNIYASGKGSYVVLLPGCSGASTRWGNYNFCPSKDKDFSDNNMDWLWFNYDVETSTAKYQYATSSAIVGQWSPNGVYAYCGISFGVASKTEITGTAYDVIYQANYGKVDNEGMYFKR